MSAIDVLRSFAETSMADHIPISDGVTYGDAREALRELQELRARDDHSLEEQVADDELIAQMKRQIDQLKDFQRAKEKTVQGLKKELEVAKSFHDVAVKERDLERTVVERHSETIVKMANRLKKIVLYYGSDEVDAVIERWQKGDDGEIDWLNPPDGVDAALEALS